MSEKDLLIPKENEKEEKSKIYQIFIYIIFFINQIKQTLFEIKSRKVSFLLGVSSCIIVVWMVAISFSSLDQIPLIFLRLAEIRNGEFDLELKMNRFLNGTSLNYTRIENMLETKLHSPRYFETISLYSSLSCKGEQVPNSFNLTYQEWMWMYKGKYNNDTCSNDNCVSKYCKDNLITFLKIIDTEKEKRMGFGRDWKYEKIPYGEIYISKGISNIFQAKKGDYLIFPIQYLNGPFQELNLKIEKTFLIPFKIGEIIEEPYGKFSNENISVILAEYSTFLNYSSNFIHYNYNQSVRDDISKINFYQYASEIYVNLEDRIEKYKESDYDIIQSNLINFSSRILYFLGFNQLETSFPILTLLFQTRFISLFLGLIISIIITILTILSIVLIYSLLLINVETRTFELGVLRMMGMTKLNIISLVLLQSFSYSIPGWIFGLILGQISYVGISYLLGIYLELKLNYLLSLKSILISSFLGLFIPILSSIFPILSALNTSLNESLDTSRSKSQAVKYSIERSSELGIHYPTVIIGLVGTIFGFSIYYFMPLALLSFNITLLLYLFFGILLAMLLGLVILSLNLETLLENILTFLFFFWENSAIQDIIKKNLISHRIRNRKTTIMFSLSLAFIIFISISFDVQTQSFRYETLQRFGSRINLIAHSPSSINNLDVLEKIYSLKNESYISGISMMSYDFRVLTNTNTFLLNTGRTKQAIQSIRAILPNYFEVTGTQFLTQTNSIKSGWNLGNQLYSIKGSNSILIGSTFEKLMNLNLNSTLNIDIRFSRNISRALLKPISFLSVGPGLRFSQFPLITNQDCVISFTSFLRLSKLTNNPIQSIENIGIEKVFISTKNDVTEKDIEKLKLLISKLGLPVRFEDVEDRLKLLTIAIQVMFFFFIFTTFVSMFMCFFSLCASMYSNIFEQSKEIGILRAIGTRKFIIIRIYIYEAFILIITSGIMGLFIGIILSYTMSIQRTLFTQLPIPFVFPYQVVITIFILAILFAILSSIFPTFILLNSSITDVMKRMTN